ncbi:MAG: carbohydrate ABC transporter permease, partial [Phycisphaerae bacterium]|nr:carbohydrate ABC transporter permease [Phycisphaerae bacterium]
LRSRLLVHFFLLLAAVAYLGPFLWMISTSLKKESQAVQMPPQWIPHPLQPHNYVRVFNSPAFDMSLYARNTLIIALLAALGSVFSSSLVAYSLAKMQWRGRNVVFGIALASMMIPFPVLMVPLYRIFREFGWIGTNLPLWVPAFFGVPFFIFLLRQFYMTIPKELSEAAVMDGCTHFGIWWRIMLPLTRPALAVVGLFAFMGAWNNFLGPLVYLTHQSTFTLPLALQFYQSRSGGTTYNLLMAASVIVIMPILILFFLAQKTFVRGIATTGLK